MYQLPYTPARLVKSANGWYITFQQTNPDTRLLERFRERYNLNRIKSIPERRRLALQKIAELNKKLLPAGYPYSSESALPLGDALEKAFRSKISDRPNTNKTYRTLQNRLHRFLSDRDLLSVPPSYFTKAHAFEFMQTIIEEGLRNVTYNNLKTHASIIFNVLKKNEHIAVNPFEHIANRKAEQKARNPLNRFQKRLIIETIKSEAPFLLLPVLLVYYCFIRPKEIRMLRVGDVDIRRGLISIRGEVSKNKRSEFVTIPSRITPELAAHLEGASYRDFVFSRDYCRPGPESVSRDYLSKQHKKIVRIVSRELDTTGVTFYSWKDTGALDMVEAGIDILTLMKQLRHKHLDTTQRYLQGFGVVIDKIKNIDDYMGGI